MGVQLGSKVIWAGLRACDCDTENCRAAAEAVTVLPR